MLTEINIIHLDDDILFLEAFEEAMKMKIRDQQVSVLSATQVDEFKNLYKKVEHAHVVVLDINLSNSSTSGFDMIKDVKKQWPGAAIVMCSSRQDLKIVKGSLIQGADDFIFKGASDEELALRIKHALEQSRHRQIPKAKTHELLNQKIGVGRTFEAIVRRVPMLIDSAVSAIHITGESGTGKEIVADIFKATVDSRTPFQRVNCGAISPTLLEGELFGYIKGAFTGANTNKKGIIESCHGGWIVLDEVATLSPSAQVSLLRVLENKTVRPLGATEDRKINIRVLSSTNESIPALVEQGKFRGDLWQRLCEAKIKLTPLRQRMDEFDALVHHFCQNMETGPYMISENVTTLLKQYDWHHGNIRELRNTLRAMTELATNKHITPIAIPQDFWERAEAQEENLPSGQTSQETIKVELTTQTGQSFDDLVLQLIFKLMNAEFEKKGKLTIRQLSDAIGIPRSTLSKKLKDLVYSGHVSAEDLSRMVGVGKIKGF